MSWIHKYAVAAMPTTVLMFLVPVWPRGYHLPLVRNWVKVTEKAHVWVPTYFEMVQLVFIDHNPCPEFTIWWLLQYPPLFCCCLFLFDAEAIICHWWGMEPKRLEKHHIYGMKFFPSCSWSILIIIHVLNSQICGCCNVHHCFDVPCSCLTQRLSFATGEELSQSDW
jgi:hypothetical protein